VLNIANFSIELIIVILFVNSIMFSNLVEGLFPPGYWEEYNNKISALKALTEKPSPRHQLSDGIRYQDVVCSNDLVLMLKWSANSVACVKFQTVDKLVERGWGIPNEGTLIVPEDCSNWFEIYYDDASKHVESKVIKTVRDSLSELGIDPKWGNYDNIWTHIRIFEIVDNENGFNVIVNGGYDVDSKEFEKINETMMNIEGVINVEGGGVVCV